MQLNEQKVKYILNKYKGMFQMLEQYDKTRVWPLGKKRIDITLSKRTIQKLKTMKEKTGKPVSQIIEEALQKTLQ